MGSTNSADALAEYPTLLLQDLRLLTTPKKHSNVLQHMMGYFKKVLTGDEKKELIESIDSFRQGWLPRVVPLALLSHYARTYRVEHLQSQFYLNPHPVELQLRTHA